MPTRWTVLVYMAADNDLGTAPRGKVAPVDADLVAIVAAKSSPEVNVIVQVVRRHGLVTRWRVANQDKTAIPVTKDPGPVDTGAPGPLADFIKWGLTTYPCTNSAVIVWGHGSGVVDWGEGGLARRSDDASAPLGSRRLSLPQLRKEFEASGHAPLGLIGLDACLMGTVEVAYELRKTAAFFAACEIVEYLPWPYTQILSDLAAAPTTTPAALAKNVVDRYASAHPSRTSPTAGILAAIDLGKLDALAHAFKALTTAALAGAPGSLKPGTNARAATNTIFDYYVDLREFVHALPASAPREATLASLAGVLKGVAKVGPIAKELSGLSLFYPSAPSVQHYLPDYDQLQFPSDTQWGGSCRRSSGRRHRRPQCSKRSLYRGRPHPALVLIRVRQQPSRRTED